MIKLSQCMYKVGRQVVERVWLHVFFDFPLLAISCLGSMAAAVGPNGLRNIHYTD